MMRFTSVLILFTLILGAKAEGKPEVEINLSTKGNDIAFDQAAVQVPLDVPIKIVFVNKAKHDSQILHNIAILKPGTLDAVLKEFESIDYDIAKISKNPNVLAITKNLEPGGKETLTLGPDKIKGPGFYPYVCLIPGHGDILGMKGVLNVVKMPKK